MSVHLFLWAAGLCIIYITLPLTLCFFPFLCLWCVFSAFVTQAHCPAARPSTGRDAVSLMHTDSGSWLSACVSAHTVRIRLPFKARDRTLKIGAVNNNVKTIVFRTKGQSEGSSSEDGGAEWTGVSLMAVTGREEPEDEDSLAEEGHHMKTSELDG